MAQHTLARMYDNFGDAEVIVRDLEAAGIPHGDISLVANADAQGRTTGMSNPSATTTDSTLDSGSGTGAAAGALAGTVLGGGAGLLAGIGALAIPGVGPVVAAGWLVAALTGAGIGAASGGLVGSLTGAGVSHDEAHVYAEGVKRGGSLVTVRVDEAQAPRVETIMAQRPSVDWQQRRSSYGSDWRGLDETSRDVPSGRDTTATSAAPLPEREVTYAPGTDPARRL